MDKPNPNIDNRGSGNRFVLIKKDGSVEENPRVDGLKIVFFGNDNEVVLHEPVPKFSKCVVQMHTRARFILHGSPYYVQNMIVWKMRANTRVEIGRDFSCVGMQIAMHAEENLEVTFGDGCMVSHDVYIQPTDAHSIIDMNTLGALNPGGSIRIGNNVWIGPEVYVCKGVRIADDVIVGARSIVTRSIDRSNVVAVAPPLRILRENVIWTRSSPYDYNRKKESEHIMEDREKAAQGRRNDRGNKFVLIKENGEEVRDPVIPGFEARFLGENCTVIVHEPLPVFVNCVISMGDGATFELQGSKYRLRNLTVSRMKPGCSVRIGKNFSCEGLELPMHGEMGLSVRIGDECMFSHGITMYVSDFHGIYDDGTGEPLNFGGDIVIGNHVWIGAGVTVLKNSAVGDDSVIGTRALVCGKYPPHCVVAGVPGQVIREGVNWSRDNCQILARRREVRSD